MKLSKFFYCFLLIFLFSLIKCETIKRVFILKIDGEKWKKDQGHNILRDKYGDACIKVAIRKCFKTLMQVSKKVCNSYHKCNSTLKSDFKSQAKTKCLREFDYREIENKNNSQEYTDEEGDSKVQDATRKQFLDVCIPHMIPQNRKNNNGILRNDALGTLVEQILRSSSEKECKQLSRDKCIKACDDVSSEVCSIHECSRRRKSAFKNTCKKECHRAYQVHTASTSSSDSES